MASSRLPVDRVDNPDGSVEWQPSPGGLVTALEPVMQKAEGVWVGWPGSPGDPPDPFDAEGMHLVGVGLSAAEVRDYYEGFCNATLWPLYHDVIVPPAFHRSWWDAYVRVNRRYAETVAGLAAPGATVWVHDYQLQLVPAMVREQRPDVRIGFFTHIPFPGYEIFAQLPWRRQIVEGLLGADLLGFQRRADAVNFLRACRRTAGLSTTGSLVRCSGRGAAAGREVRVGAFPISIDSAAFEQVARQDTVQTRAKEIREALGNPDVLLLGIDRLDYTKGILHRLNAYGELLDQGRFGEARTVLVTVASPSRERVEQYRLLRDEVEVTVGRINGEHAELGSPAIDYLHQTYPREEMAALYLAADVMLVTSLRDGMNLVAKEYVACRYDETGALVLSEFTGAADELTSAILVNPHDIEGLKDAIIYASFIAPNEAKRRMRSMRRRVREHDVAHWAAAFLDALAQIPEVKGPVRLRGPVRVGLPVRGAAPVGRRGRPGHPHASRPFLAAHLGGHLGRGRGGEDRARGGGEQRERDKRAGVAAPHDEPALVLVLKLGGGPPAAVLVAWRWASARVHGACARIHTTTPVSNDTVPACGFAAHAAVARLIQRPSTPDRHPLLRLAMNSSAQVRSV